MEETRLDVNWFGLCMSVYRQSNPICAGVLTEVSVRTSDDACDLWTEELVEEGLTRRST